MSVAAASLNSKLDLAFEVDPSGVTRLRHRRAGGLCHVGKPYWNGDVLLTQLINPTAGLFAGDRLHATFDLGPGCSVLLSNPSATRLHTMTSGRTVVDQRYQLAPGSFLEVQPDLIIPQRNSEGEIRSRVEAHGDASFFILDLLAPGRTACGESIAWREVTAGIDILIDGELHVRERARLNPAHHSWRLESPEGESCYVANLWLRFPAIEQFSTLLASSESLTEAFGTAGASEVAPGLGVIRLMTTRSTDLRRACQALRTHWSAQVPALKARTGKL